MNNLKYLKILRVLEDGVDDPLDFYLDCLFDEILDPEEITYQGAPSQYIALDRMDARGTKAAREVRDAFKGIPEDKVKMKKELVSLIFNFVHRKRLVTCKYHTCSSLCEKIDGASGDPQFHDALLDQCKRQIAKRWEQFNVRDGIGCGNS